MTEGQTSPWHADSHDRGRRRERRATSPRARRRRRERALRRGAPASRRRPKRLRDPLAAARRTGERGPARHRHRHRRTRPSRTCSTRASAAPPAAARPAGRRITYTLQPGDRVVPMTPLRRLVAEHGALEAREPHVRHRRRDRHVGREPRARRAQAQLRAGPRLRLSFLPFIVHATVRALRNSRGSTPRCSTTRSSRTSIGIWSRPRKASSSPSRATPIGSRSPGSHRREDLATRALEAALGRRAQGRHLRSRPRHTAICMASRSSAGAGWHAHGRGREAPGGTLEGERGVIRRSYLALSYDHRAVDGAPANGFLHRIRELLEEAEFDL